MTSEVPVSFSADGITSPLKGIRRAAARHMISAWEAPSFQLSVEVDMTLAAAVKTAVPTATVTDVIVRSCAEALAAHPSVNAWYSDMSVTAVSSVNVGVAVATPAGLTVPVIHAANELSLDQVASRRRDVVERARTGSLARADITGGTFTVSNLGMLDIDHFGAILNVPQVAILAVGSTRQRYVWNGGQPEWRPTAVLTLTCDHRAIDGVEGAAFLGTVKNLVQLVPFI